MKIKDPKLYTCFTKRLFKSFINMGYMGAFKKLKYFKVIIIHACDQAIT